MQEWRDPLISADEIEQDDLLYKTHTFNGQIAGYVLWACFVRGQVVVYRENTVAKKPNQIANMGTRVEDRLEALEVFPQIVGLEGLGLGYGYPKAMIGKVDD